MKYSNLRVGDIIYIDSIPLWGHFSKPLKVRVVSNDEDYTAKIFPIRIMSLETYNTTKKGMIFGIYDIVRKANFKLV